MIQVLLQKFSPNLALTDGPFTALKIGPHGGGYCLLGQRAEGEPFDKVANVISQRGGVIVFEASGVTFDEGTFFPASGQEAPGKAPAAKKARKPRKKREAPDAPAGPVRTTADTGTDDGDEAE